MKYSVGQKVKIRSLEWYRDNINRYGIIECGKYEFFEPMNEYCGKVVTIKRIDDDNYRIDTDKGAFCWTDEMIEGLVEDTITTNEQLFVPSNISLEKEMEWNLPEGYIFKDENGNVINATKIVLEKKKKEYDKGTKVRHKTKEMVETVVGVCKIKYMGVWVDGVIYEGNDTNTGEPMTFVRVKEDFENNFEVL